MELTAEDMKQGNEETISYWATESGKQQGNKQEVEIATLSSKGGEATDSYECTLTVTVTSENDTDLTALGTGNVNLYLSGVLEKTLDLSDKTEYQNPITQQVTLTGEDTDKSLKAAFEIKNNKDTDQSNAAGKTIKVTVKSEISNCALAAGD